MTFCRAVAHFYLTGGALVAFGVVSAVFNSAVYALFGFTVCHDYHPFRQLPLLFFALQSEIFREVRYAVVCNIGFAFIRFRR